MIEETCCAGSLEDPPRYRRCRWALCVRADGGSAAVEAAPYRRCPVGVISDVDCPEYSGQRCGCHEDRGEAPARVVSPEEIDVLARELSRDYLTESYRRRLAALRARRVSPERGADLLLAYPAPPAVPVPVPVRIPHLVAEGPVNVPADRARPRAAGAVS